MLSPWNFDPWNFDPWQILRQAPRALPGAPPPQLPAFTPEEQEAETQSLLSRAAGGMSYVGEVIDKTFGDRALRQVLSGLSGGPFKASELFSFIPGSDTFGLTDPANKVTGEQLAKTWGMIGEGEKGTFEAQDLVGPALEIGLGPSTFLTFGASALGKAGKIARNIGAAPKTARERVTGTLRSVLDARPELMEDAGRAAGKLGVRLEDVLDKPLGGLAGLRFPFSDSVLPFGGEGALNALGALGRGASYIPGSGLVASAWDKTKPIRLALRAAFDPEVMGMARTDLAQDVGRGVFRGIEKGLTEVRGMKANMIRSLEEGGVLDRGADFRRIAETGLAPNELADPAAQLMRDVGVRGHGFLDQERAKGLRLGLGADELADTEITHWSRQQLQLDRPTPGYARPTSGAASGTLEGREDILRNIPGGTELGLNPLSIDPAFSGLKAKKFSELGPSNFGSWIKAGTLDTENVILQNAAELRRRWPSMDIAQSTGLARWLADMDPQYAAQGIPFFGNHPINDFTRAAVGQVTRNNAAEGVHELFAQTAELGGQPGWVQVKKVFDDMKEFKNPDDALLEFGRRKGIKDLPQMDRPQLLETLRGQGIDVSQIGSEYTDDALRQIAQANNAKDVLNWYVPPEVIGDVKRLMEGFSKTPPGALLALADGVTSLTKALQTTIWPAFHVRNFTSGIWQNWIVGAGDLQSYRDAMGIMRRTGAETLTDIPAFRGMTNEQASKALADAAFAHRVTGTKIGLAGEMFGEGGLGLPARQADELRRSIPGMADLPGLGDVARTYFGKDGSWRELEKFGPVQAGRQVGDFTENVNRLAGFIGLLRQGYNFESAAMKIRAAHVDYQMLSDFERNVMRRLIPFYTFSRKNIPYALQELIERPGGLAGTYIKFGADLREQAGGFVPEYLGGGLALPLGEEKAGTQRYLTNLDLPSEQFLQFVHSGPKGLERTGQTLLGQLNPLLKGPLEQATGTQFFTGRKLADLHSRYGLNQRFEQVLANSPLSRVGSTLGSLMDERKWQDPYTLPARMLTGVGLTDVDVVKQKNLQAREILDDIIRQVDQARRFSTTTIPKELWDQLPPKVLKELALKNQLEAEARKAAMASLPQR